MAEGGFDFKKFIDDSMKVITSPKEYFTSMPKEGGFVEPIVKAVIYGLIAGIIVFIWSLLKLSAASAMFGGAVGAMSILWGAIGAIIGLFIGGVIILILSAIGGGNTNYEANVRVAASLMVMSPVNALLSFTAGINLYLGAIITFLVALFGIWLLYNGLVNALGAKEVAAKVIAIILAIFPLLGLLGTLVCKPAASKMTDSYMKGEAKQQEKAMKDMMKQLEKMQKQQQ